VLLILKKDLLYIFVLVINNLYLKVASGFHKKFIVMENNLLNKEMGNLLKQNFNFFCMT